MRSRSRRYRGIARSKLSSGAPSCSTALKRNQFSVRIGTITHVLAILRQHVAELAAVIYLALRALTTLALMWVYILVASASPSSIQARVVATLILAAGLMGC